MTRCFFSSLICHKQVCSMMKCFVLTLVSLAIFRVYSLRLCRRSHHLFYRSCLKFLANLVLAVLSSAKLLLLDTNRYLRSELFVFFFLVWFSTAQWLGWPFLLEQDQMNCVGRAVMHSEAITGYIMDSEVHLHTRQLSPSSNSIREKLPKLPKSTVIPCL